MFIYLLALVNFISILFKTFRKMSKVLTSKLKSLSFFSKS